MKAALQHCNLGANGLHVAHAKIAFIQLTGTQLRLAHLQTNRTLHKGIRSNKAGSPRACCSVGPSSKERATIRDKASILRRAVLGGILLSAGAMPFTPRRFSSASAADLTADKVETRHPALRNGFGSCNTVHDVDSLACKFTSCNRVHDGDKSPELQVLENPQWPDSIPFREEDFQRYDPSSDKLFYDSPRFVTHIDDAAIAALTK